MRSEERERRHPGAQPRFSEQSANRPLITPGAAVVIAGIALVLALLWVGFAILYLGSHEKSPCAGDAGVGIQLALSLVSTAAAARGLMAALAARRGRPAAIRRFAVSLGGGAAAFVAWGFFFGVACG